MLLLKPFIKESWSVDAAACAWHHFTFITRVGFSASTLACLVDSLVRVSRRVGKSLFDRIAQSPSGHTPTGTPELEASPWGSSSLCGSATPFCLTKDRKPLASLRQDHGLLTVPIHPNSYANDIAGLRKFTSTASFSTVSGLLTLFSKFFSSFLHSTCSLSVSYMYLALGEVYLPLRAAIPNNPTL